MFRTDICIAGAGIIGLSIALELHARGLSVAVIEAGKPLRQASTAAAGMLAGDDPENPAALHALAQLSLSLYPGFLSGLHRTGGTSVPFQTTHTLQIHSSTEISPLPTPLLIQKLQKPDTAPAGSSLLEEHSLDPRQLASAVLAAVDASSIRLLPDAPVLATRVTSTAVQVKTPSLTLEADSFVDCTGAWSADPAYKVVPIKGQMLAVALPADFPLSITVRTPRFYVVPRTRGPNAGRAIVGATTEDAGFDTAVHASQIAELQRAAIALMPQLRYAEVIDRWAGLRPATADRLPLLGPHPSRRRHWVAAGHYRNGILLAPATARIMAQLLLGEPPSISVYEFDPARPSVQPS